MNIKANRKRTPLLMVIVLSFVAMPLALRTVGVRINFGCVMGAVLHVWGHTLKTVGSIYHPAIAADLANLSNSFADETLHEPCTERLVCQNVPTIKIEALPEIAPSDNVESKPATLKCTKHSARIIAPEMQADVVVVPEQVAVTIIPEPVQVKLTPVAFRNFVPERDIRKFRQAVQRYAQAEVLNNITCEGELKKGIQELQTSCNFAALKRLQQSEKAKAFRVVIKTDPQARGKEEFRFFSEPEVSEF